MTIKSKFLNFLLRPAVLAAVTIATVAAGATAYHFSTNPASPTKAAAPAKAGTAEATMPNGMTASEFQATLKEAEIRRNRDDAEWCIISQEVAEDFHAIRERERWGAGDTIANKLALEQLGEKLDRMRYLKTDSEAMTRIITTNK